jgi:hypothetical protein
VVWNGVEVALEDDDVATVRSVCGTKSLYLPDPVEQLKTRDLIQRILILTPANLTFQWQRELKDQFRENFEVIRGDVLRANYGSNPWQDKNQVVTSVSWVSRIEDAK